MEPADLARLLVASADEDLAVRQELVEAGELFTRGYHPVLQELHQRNAERLAGVIDRIGWPTAAVVGERAAGAAWLLAQHAIGDPSFFRRCAELVAAAARRDEIPARFSARMQDRIRVLEGRPQIYGTQFDWNEAGEFAPCAIEDPDGIDERRLAMGLETLAEQTAAMRERARREGDRPPADAAQRRAEAERWAREVGWRR